MIRAFRRRFLTVRYDYEDRLDSRRAGGLLVISFFSFLVAALWVSSGILIFLLNPADGFPVEVAPPTAFMTTALLLAIYLMIQRGRLRTAINIFVITVFIAVSPAFFLAGLNGSHILLIMLPLLLAGSLVERRSYGFVLALAAGIIASGLVTQLQDTSPISTIPANRAGIDLMTVFLLTLIALALLYVFNGWAQNIAFESGRAIRTLSQIGELGQNLRGQDRDTVLENSLRFVRERMDADFAQFFLVNEDGQVYQRMRVSAGIRGLTDSREAISLAETNIINQAIKARSIQTVSIDANIVQRAHFLPSTQFGAAIPIMSGDQVLAVLDVQHDHDMNLSDEHQATLMSLAQSIANAIVANSEINRLRQDLRYQEEIIKGLRDQIDRVIRREGIVSSSWETYLQQRESPLFGFDAQDGQFTPASELPEAMQQVMLRGELLQDRDANHQIVHVPIKLQDRMLGAMTFKVPHSRPLTQRQLDTARKIADSLAQALENRRLLEQTRAQALRERKATAASELLSATNDVETVMRLAAESFREALGAVTTRIHLQPDRENPGAEKAESEEELA